MCYFHPCGAEFAGHCQWRGEQPLNAWLRGRAPSQLEPACPLTSKAFNLGPKAIMFFAATAGIVIGGPLALWLVGQSNPEVLGGNAPDAYWRG